MSKSGKKKNDWYYEWWIWAIIIFLFLFIKSRSGNLFSPIILVIGLLCVAFSTWKLWINKKSQSEDNEKKSVKVLSIVIIIGFLLSILGYATLSIDKIQRKEKLLKVEFSGINDNSSPLSALDLKLLKNDKTYTIIGTLKKTSTTPAESYFDFDIILIDKHGKYIETKEVSTKPTVQNDNNTLFTFESRTHFEEDMYVFEDNKPVKVEFANIKEYSKDVFINNTIKEAREYLEKSDFSYAQRCIDLVLKYTPATEEIQKLLKYAQQGIIPTPTDTQSEELFIIGSDRETVRNILNGYKEKSSIMGENAIDFDNDNLLVTVFFANEKAEGVIFLSNNLDNMNMTTGEGSYVSQHYDELIKMATNDTSIKIENDMTKLNSQGKKKVASELYIGNTPYTDANNSTSNSTSPTTSSTKQSNNNSPEDKEKSEFSYCLESGIVAGVKIYLKPNNESYVGTITAFSDEIYNEKGKKEKAVYLSGGSNDGWYKRSEIKKCYVRKDDPNLPSTRLIDKY